MKHFNQFIGEVITAMPPLRPAGLEAEIRISVFYDAVHEGCVDIIEHEHPFYEIAWLPEGEMNYSVDGSRITCSAENRQVFILPGGKLHRRCSDSERTRIRSMEVAITPSGPHGTVFVEGFNRALEQCGYKFTLSAGQLSRIRLIEAECRKRGLFSTEILQHEIPALLLDMIRSILPEGVASPGPETTDSRKEICHYILMRIEDLVNRTFEMGALTYHFHLSARHLNRLFRAEYGMSIRQYAALRRIAHAERLLKAPGSTVREVAAALGFSSPSHFIAFFRKYRNMTPARYREQFTNGEAPGSE